MFQKFSNNNWEIWDRMILELFCQNGPYQRRSKLGLAGLCKIVQNLNLMSLLCKKITYFTPKSSHTKNKTEHAVQPPRRQEGWQNMKKIKRLIDWQTERLLKTELAAKAQKGDKKKAGNDRSRGDNKKKFFLKSNFLRP